MRNTDYASAEDFKRWQEAAKKMTLDALAFSIVDARAAARACDGHNPERAGKYRDEAATYHSELARRERALRSKS